MITWWEWVLIIVGSIFGVLLLFSLVIFFKNPDRFICACRHFPHPDPYEHAIREAIKTGLLMSNIPAEMIQGKKEVVEVKIARSTELQAALVTGLLGRGVPVVEPIDTSLYMEVKLSGEPAFEIDSPSPPEQMIIPTPALWVFDVTPYRAGNQTITLIVNLRVEAEGIVGGRRSVSVLKKPIHVQVNLGFATRRYITNNWQWLIPTILTLAGAIAAWLVVPF
jgi:hypothetical protein